MYQKLSNIQRFLLIIIYSFFLEFLKISSYKNKFCKFLITKKRSFLKPISHTKRGLGEGIRFLNHSFITISFGLAFLFINSFCVIAQNSCPGCEIQVPDSLQIDTFYLQELPDGAFQVPYDANISFRLPVNTSEVLHLDPSLPANIAINAVKITAINNLPAGLIWKSNKEEYLLPTERNGCLKICGIPLQHGLFEVEIIVSAQVSIISRDAVVRWMLFIAPPKSDNKGFSMINNVGCGSTTVAFINNNPSAGKTGYSYEWDFGNGARSQAEQPDEQKYDIPGVYPINYQVVIDTLGAVLTSITIVEAPCNDIFSKADFYFRLYDSLDMLIFESKPLDNVDPPLSFPFNLKLAAGLYRLEVWDSDAGLEFKDDFCGAVQFTSSSRDTLQEGGLKALLTIIQLLDTIRIQDSVVVLEVPAKPIIEVAATHFCEGETTTLNTSYIDNNQWYKDSLPIENANRSNYIATTTGGYYVSHTNTNGCIAFSESVDIETITPPAAPVFSNTNNVLELFNPNILPIDFELNWYQEGNLLDATGMELCITENGKYALELNDLETGCASLFETSVVVDAAIDCTTSTANLSSYLSHVTLYPNPTEGVLYLDISLNTSIEDLSLRIVNVLGQPVLQQNFAKLEGKHRLELNLAKQTNGLYWIVIESKEGVSSWKVWKE